MAQDIFGASSMGYAVIESERMDRWRTLLKDGIGLHEAQADSDVLAYRMDGRVCRAMVMMRGPPRTRARQHRSMPREHRARQGCR